MTASPAPRRRSRPVLLAAILAALVATPATAQVPPGAAVVFGQGADLMKLVDPTGGVTTLTGFQPITQDASCVLAAREGLVIVGLRAANRGGGASLGLRLVIPSGGAVVDLPLATLMQVPVGTEWHVVDLKQRADGRFLVLASELPNVLGGDVPTAVFVADLGGGVTAVPTPAFAPGIPTAIADLGDRYAVVVVQPFFVLNSLFQTARFDGVGAPVTVTQLIGIGGVAGLDRDAAGDLVFAATSGAGPTMFRLAPIVGSTPTAIAGGPGVPVHGCINPAGTMVTVSANAGLYDLLRSDTVLGGTTVWLTGWPGEVRGVSQRPDPEMLGARDGVAPRLATQGGEPVLGNGAFALRLFDPGSVGAVSLALVAVGDARTLLPTPLGELFVDPAGTVLGLGTAAIPFGQAGTLPLPLPPAPALAGAALTFQALVAELPNGPARLSTGLGVVLR
ncbi:MAG: hypothetical protein AB7O97_15245 [Planctomycetota bacterium]